MRFIFKTRYQQDIAIFKHDGQRLWFGILAIAVLLAPLVLDTFYLGELALVYICAIAGIGLMLLVGYTGLVSLGHAAFLAIGAYTHAILMTNGLPFPASLILAGLVCTVIGAIIGLPAMRMTGIYLAIATLAFAFIVEHTIAHLETLTGGFRGMVVPRPVLFGYLSPDTFTILTSIQLLLMVVVGGLGSLHGVVFGAFFIVLLPQGIAFLRDWLPPTVGQLPGLEPGLFGFVLLLFLIYEPLGIYGRWRKIRDFFEAFPLYRKATHKRQRSYLRTERVK